MLLARQKGADKGAGELVASRGEQGSKVSSKGERESKQEVFTPERSRGAG